MAILGAIKPMLTVGGRTNKWQLDEYVKRGGYSALKKSLRTRLRKKMLSMKSRSLFSEDAAVAGFPTGPEWSFMPRVFPATNMLSAIPMKVSPVLSRIAISSVQPACGDRGMTIAAYAMGAARGYNYIHGEVWESNALRRRFKRLARPVC